MPTRPPCPQTVVMGLHLMLANSRILSHPYPAPCLPGEKCDVGSWNAFKSQQLQSQDLTFVFYSVPRKQSIWSHIIQSATSVQFIWRSSSIISAPPTATPTPEIAEEDECPICHLELPSRSLENFESLRESHITSCIQSHSTFGSPRTGEGGEPQAAPRLTGMYTYPATEKDCVDDAECTICLEEFVVGVPMARLECLCRFHRSCIVAWFVNHPGRCPVHQHDGFGY
uniref:RING-type E3 ubiquitin transferase n=1 Tax=Bionectria ochroleuca TaxID=29856 RepID=A0A8H7TM24_BIOOC